MRLDLIRRRSRPRSFQIVVRDRRVSRPNFPQIWTAQGALGRRTCALWLTAIRSPPAAEDRRQMEAHKPCCASRAWLSATCGTPWTPPDAPCNPQAPQRGRYRHNQAHQRLRPASVRSRRGPARGDVPTLPRRPANEAKSQVSRPASPQFQLRSVSQQALPRDLAGRAYDLCSALLVPAGSEGRLDPAARGRPCLHPPAGGESGAPRASPRLDRLVRESRDAPRQTDRSAPLSKERLRRASLAGGQVYPWMPATCRNEPRPGRRLPFPARGAWHWNARLPSGMSKRHPTSLALLSLRD